MDLGKDNSLLEKILFNKDGFRFSSIKKNYYTLEFNMENNNIILASLIDFNLIKLIYDLNPDVYEKNNIQKINDNEIISTLLMKHFFEDIGFPQRFSFIHMKKIVEDNRIIFNAQSIKSSRPANMPLDAELMNMNEFQCICDIITPHKINCSFNITFDETMNVPNFVEKMMGMILHKIFIRVKQFIENILI
jgi:hypothetical protein